MTEVGGSFDDPSGATGPIMPIPDRAYAPVFPYRGTQDHGVPVDNQNWIPEDADEASWQGETTYDVPVEPIAPIPVEIVNSGQNEIRAWRAVHFNVGKVAPVLIIGQNVRMTKVTIRHAGTAADDGVLWFGHDSNVTPNLSGWPLFARELVEINTAEEIYAVMGAGTAESTPVAVIIEVTVG
jgi:hypothetical protein